MEVIENESVSAYQQMARGEENAADKSLLVLFHMDKLPNPTKTAEQGRPIYDEVEYIKIASAGDRHNIIDRPVTEVDKRRFAVRYAAWKKGESDGTSGLPLKEWPAISKAQAEELLFFNCRTVEQLANMTDENARKFSGIGALRQKARDYLEFAKSNAPLVKMREELSVKDNQIATLERLLREQAGRIERLESRTEPSKGEEKKGKS